MGLLFGPSMSRVSQVQNILEGGVHSVAHSDADESNTKERSAVREVSRLITPVGSFTLARNNITDAVPGEAANPKQ